MRNLSISRIGEINVSINTETLPITAASYDYSTGDIILARGPSPSNSVIELQRCSRSATTDNFESAPTAITTWDAPCPLPDLECDKILSLRYVAEIQTSCIVLAGGDLILVRDNPSPDVERIEIVGSIDVGIYAAAWSWDGSILAVVTRQGGLVLMTQQLEPIKESAFTDDDLRLSKHVSVGWGKKETQFQGKRAKAMKDPTMPETVDEGSRSDFDDDSTSITWRGDGAYVAVNSRLNSDRRVIRVYSADGILNSVSEPVDALEQAVSWRPHGNVIAGIKRSSDKIQTVFFERNGLRHGEFDLRLRPEEMPSSGKNISLAWNGDSSILGVLVTDRVQFWTMSNYHYYLKREIWLDDPGSLIWHTNDARKCLIYSPERLLAISFDFEAEPASMSTPNDYGLVGVVDGSKLKVTPFKHVNIPPPMAYAEVDVGDNIATHSISGDGRRMVVLTKDHIHLYDWNMLQSNKSDFKPRHSPNAEVQKVLLPAKLRQNSQYSQIAVLNNDTIYIFTPARGSGEAPKAHLYCVSWTNASQQTDALSVIEVDTPSAAVRMLSDSIRSNVWLCSDHEILPVMGQVENLPAFTVSYSVSRKIFIANFSTSFENSYCCFWIDKQNNLIFEETIRARDITSCALTDRYIVYTTSNHLLKFAHLIDPSQITFPLDDPEHDERCRSIERGATIVTIIPSAYAVVLQMPRGNLETIFPRLLVLGGVREKIKNLEFRSAFLTCQTHQIDLNILHDYDVQLWEANVERFVDQLKKPSRVDEFIQKLKEDDVSKTLYRDTRASEAMTNGVVEVSYVKAENKVNKICDALINMLKTKPAVYQQNTITAHVCKRPPDLVAALTMVSDLRRESRDEADLAVAHLCFLSDANRLFDAALALYDLELTLLVAQNAQRDPREYVPFLQSLQALPHGRRQYTIDNHLKKYVKALGWLHILESHDEVEAYAVKHRLYTTAIQLYEHDGLNLQKIKRRYADFLVAESQYQHAATLYESLSDVEAAYPLYALAHQWREAMTCASLVPISDEKLQDLAKQFASSCIEESRDYRSAATVYLEYLEDPIAAAESLCRGSYFAEAGRILSHPRRKLAAQIPIVIDPMLTKKFGEIIELIADCQSQLWSQTPRIAELRRKKAEDPLAFFGGDAAIDGPDIPDNVSLAPTDASTLGDQSMFTRYGGGAGGIAVSTKFGGTIASNASRKTSKTKRREERKRARGKKGSVYEEEYLVASVTRLIERVNSTHDEVRRLYSGLVRRGFAEQARKVEEIMSKMQQACEDARQQVWESPQHNESTAVKTTYDVNGDGRPNGADGVLYDSQVEMQASQRKPPPDIKVWKSS